jgi:hypothetical protein
MQGRRKMIRFLAGGLSALLLVAAGVFLGISHAQNEEIVPPAPAPQAAATAEKPLPAAPSAEKSREEKRFDRYDMDRDELVTRVEMMETRRKPFEKLDANRDGNLSFEEWAVATSEKFGKADADRSGTLSRTEFATTRRETVPKKCAC